MIFEEVINPSINSELFFFSVPETLEPSADTTRRKEREERNKQAIHAYNEELQRKKASDNAKSTVYKLEISRKRHYTWRSAKKAKNASDINILEKNLIQTLQNSGSY